MIRYGVVANIIASHAIARGSIPRVGMLFVGTRPYSFHGALPTLCTQPQAQKPLLPSVYVVQNIPISGLLPSLRNFHCSHSPTRNGPALSLRDRNEMPIQHSLAKLSYIWLALIRRNSTCQAAPS